MEIPKVFREQVIDLFYEAFGEAEVSVIKAGKLYRWSLPRGPYSIGMFITIDSPEYTDIAHIMISDADSHQVEPVVAVTVRTLAEAKAVIDRIIAQWKKDPKPQG
jgi:hypothetical protein